MCLCVNVYVHDSLCVSVFLCLCLPNYTSHLFSFLLHVLLLLLLLLLLLCLLLLFSPPLPPPPPPLSSFFLLLFFLLSSFFSFFLLPSQSFSPLPLSSFSSSSTSSSTSSPSPSLPPLSFFFSPSLLLISPSPFLLLLPSCSFFFIFLFFFLFFFHLFLLVILLHPFLFPSFFCSPSPYSSPSTFPSRSLSFSPSTFFSISPSLLTLTLPSLMHSQTLLQYYWSFEFCLEKLWIQGWSPEAFPVADLFHMSLFNCPFTVLQISSRSFYQTQPPCLDFIWWKSPEFQTHIVCAVVLLRNHKLWMLELNLIIELGALGYVPNAWSPVMLKSLNLMKPNGS